MFWTLAVLICTSFILQSDGQAFHTVVVGDTGSFYDPPTISALQGDVITFIFSGRSHSVTQSSFNAPCTRLQGGFDSDSWGVKTPGDPVPQWNLTITNDTSTIWFYCKNTLPLPHCTSGMVGAINPPTGTEQNYTAFRAAAKAIQGTPVATPGAVLSGIGASASAVPSPIAAASSSASVSSSSSSSSSSSVQSSSTSNTPTIAPSSGGGGVSAAKVGGAVGGALGGVIVIGIIALIVLARRRRERNDAYVPTKHMYHNDASTVDNRSISWAPYQPASEFSPGPDIRPHQGSSVHSPEESIRQAPLSGYSQDSAPMSGTTVRELAAEIASIMKSNNNSVAGNSNNGNGAALTPIDEAQGSTSTRSARPLPSLSQAAQAAAATQHRNNSQETLPVYSGKDQPHNG